MTYISPRQPILLIDDSPEDLYLAKMFLERAAVTHPIVTMSDGEEAIEFLRTAMAGTPDALPFCVFSDIRMPKVNGFGVLEWSRAQKPLGKTTFAMLTGGNLAEDREKAEALGADFFLIKFPQPDVFRRIVDQACGR